MHVVHSMKQPESESMDNFYVKDEVDKMCLTELNVQQLIELIILSQPVNNTHNQHLAMKAINQFFTTSWVYHIVLSYGKVMSNMMINI